MKRSRFSEEKIIGVLKEHEAGDEVDEPCVLQGISSAKFCIHGRLSRCIRFDDRLTKLGCQRLSGVAVIGASNWCIRGVILPRSSGRPSKVEKAWRGVSDEGTETPGIPRDAQAGGG
jgi:hypothetical protein